MTIGVVHFRTGDDADIQADMNMAKILFRVLPYSSKISVKQIYLMLRCMFPIGSTYSPKRKLNRKK